MLENARRQARVVARKVSVKKKAHEEKRNPAGIFLSQFSCKDEKPCSTREFYALNTCTGCGLCVEICPTNTITLHERKPQWNKTGCTRCYACIHRCPPHAIQCGKKTEFRGRFVNPALLGHD